MSHRSYQAWELAQSNPTYWQGALSAAEGRKIHWHSPDQSHSSQVFCISAFGGLRFLPDRDDILGVLFAELLPEESRVGPWRLVLEYVDETLLNEEGGGTPSNIDVFCSSLRAVVCIESKFKCDAAEGFGGCGQLKESREQPRKCAGYYGPKSDLHTRTDASCRLEIRDGRRTPRLYWQNGRAYFLDAVFLRQASGETCPFAGPSYQLMRNFLFAEAAAHNLASPARLPTAVRPGQDFGVLCIAPTKTGGVVRQQVLDFTSLLRSEHRHRVRFDTYDNLIGLLLDSPHDASQALGTFLQRRMETLL